MPTLRFTFPGRRYHATLWGHHANEGQIEWPPCPWRILRALLACGFNKLGWRDVSELPPIARSLLEKLASMVPSYQLPDASAAHTRHYMPYISGKDQRTTLVWDTFADVGDGELLIHWPCQFSSDETALLAILARNLNYLGRSESWVEAELVPDSMQSIDQFNTVPCQECEQRDQKYEQVTLMAPIPSNSYLAWRAEKAKEAETQIKLPKNRKTPNASDREKALQPFPPDLIACLTKDTSWWKGHGWSQPPGSQRVLYWRPSQSMQVAAVRRTRHSPVPSVEIMLLAITTPSGNKSALPSITRTLPQAELFHRAIVSRAGNGHSVHCPELTGKDVRGNVLRAGHHHAHILPLDLDNDHRLDHILIFAPMGLGGTAQQAISSLKRTWTKGGIGDLQLAIVGKGNLDDLRNLPAPLSVGIERLLGAKQRSRWWVSQTPFVPPRFEKRPGKSNDLTHQVNAELRSRGLPDAKVTILPWNLPETTALRHYIRRRSHGVSPPRDIGYPLKLDFSEPVCGPISLGYASHFGMGLFVSAGMAGSDRQP